MRNDFLRFRFGNATVSVHRRFIAIIQCLSFSRDWIDSLTFSIHSPPATFSRILSWRNWCRYYIVPFSLGSGSFLHPSNRKDSHLDVRSVARAKKLLFAAFQIDCTDTSSSILLLRRSINGAMDRAACFLKVFPDHAEDGATERGGPLLPIWSRAKRIQKGAAGGDA